MSRRTTINGGKKLSEERAWRELAKASDTQTRSFRLTDGVRALFAADLITPRMANRMIVRNMTRMVLGSRELTPAQAVLASLFLEQSVRTDRRPVRTTLREPEHGKS